MGRASHPLPRHAPPVGGMLAQGVRAPSAQGRAAHAAGCSLHGVAFVCLFNDA